MAFQIRPDSEPITGYRLVERLGTGGYGEVWKATAPGGLTKAIKIVFGHIGGDRTEQELKALDRIRKARHPFLLSLERFEIIEGQLFIVTELADMSLMDRFQACKKAGMPGIPRDELLGYLLDAADALDYLQKNYDLQHLDIKPQNLLLVGGRIKVADFGLVKDLHGTSATATGGVTPVYATPEAFDGRISRFSDQYSLAIVYEEMLTGIRPFPGTTALQLAAQHASSPPLLTPLPVHDRPTIGRALAKIPEQRFPTCRDMVDNLLKGSAPAPQAAGPAGHPAAAQGELSSASLGEMGATLSGARTSSGATLPPQAEAHVTPTKKAALTPKPKGEPKPDLNDLEAFSPSGEACLRPTLVIGIGGLAGQVLRRWKQRLAWRFGAWENVPAFQVLQIETDRRAIASLQERSGGVSLEPEETLFLPLHEYMHYRKYREEWLRWIHRQWLGDIPKSLLTEGKRPLGRLALIDNAGEARERFAQVLEAVNNPIARLRTAKTAGLIFREETPQIFVIASINGGTGGGMLLDVAYLVRQILSEREMESAAPSAFLLHATSQRTSERELALGNAWATLQELHHCTFAHTAPDNQSPVYGQGPPFQDSYLLHVGDRLSDGQIQSAASALGDYLFLNAATSLGGAIDHYRRSTRPRVGAVPDKCFLRTFLLSQISFPRHRLANRVADQLSRKIVQRWNAGSEKTQDWVVQEANQFFDGLELDFDSLAVHLQAAAESGMGEEPVAYFRKLLEEAHPLTAGAAQPAAGNDQRAAWQQVENFFGAGKVATDEENESVASTLALDLIKKQALNRANEVSDKLVNWLEEAVESPEKRLPGAEAGAHAFLQKLRVLEARLGDILAEGKRSIARTRGRLAAGNFSGRPAATSWFPLARQSLDSKGRMEILLSYALDRLRLAFVQEMSGIYAVVDKHLADFLQALTMGRQGLRLLAEGFSTSLPPAQQPPPPQPAGWLELQPVGAKTLADGAREILNRFDLEKIRELDLNFQQLYLMPRGGLWKTITAKDQLGGWLRDRLRDYLRKAALDSLKNTDLPDLLLRTYPDCDEVKQALTDVVTAPSTPLPIEDGWRHFIVTLQPGEAGDMLSELLHHVVPNVTRTIVRSEGNIVICQEIAHLSAAEIAASLVGEDEGIREIGQRLLTRIDVNWLPLEEVESPCPA
jgi:eukaryotic-like serine/threonine-protein kinase